MKKPLTYACAYTLALTVAVVPALSAVPTARAASADWWLKGASFVPRAGDTFRSASFEQSVRDFQAAGGTYVNFVIPYYQSNLYSTDIAPGYNTPTDAALAAGIDYVHSLGLHAEISIYLESWDGQWRAEINPGDRDTWYKNYGAVLTHYASLAQSHGVELYMLGAELVDMASAAQNGDNTARWDAMIGSVRARYSGALTYSANRGQQSWASELPNIGFWDRLDYVGVSAYYELSGDGSLSSLESDWANVKNYDIDPIHQKTGKPVLFTEVGYRSLAGAHNHPWDSWDGGSYDSQEQVNDYTALLDFWGSVPYMQGVNLWQWSPDAGYGGSGNTDYTPQSKPVIDTMRSWWSGKGTGGPATTSVSPPGNPTFAATGSLNPANPGKGQTATFTATVTDTGDATAGAAVDLEVYDGATQVAQKYVEDQSFAAGASQTYTLGFTPPTSDTYTFKIGVFSGGWAKNYVWNDVAASTNSSTSATATSPGSLDIWWPTDGTHISGVQPFKAMIEGMDISRYHVYWQVDDGSPVEMSNSTEGYPHKESIVDISSWTWSPTGAYTVTFLAKDASGSTTLSSKTVRIMTP